MGLIKKLINSLNKSEYQREIEFEQSVIDNNLSLKQQDITAVVIRYIIKEGQDNPEILKIADFHSTTLPDKDSIIWASNGKVLKPYKVLRYDFIEDSESEINSMLYIVVKPAFINEIAEIDYY